MANASNNIKKEFLYLDQNVEFSFDLVGNILTITCEHPIFKKRFSSNTVTFGVDEFFKTSHKGNIDYDFFEKLKISLQEYLLDHGVK
ncbi:MAG: hypothetical protein M3040_14530 [Bacteroidota bacterium]|nr:hypothetical protein [Bacteroidota bacterium]